MRMLLIMGSSLALTLGLRIVDPPVASAVSPPAAVQPADMLVVPAPRAGRARPLIAVVADSDGAQTTDFIIPYGVLKDSGVADVRSVSTRGGSIHMTRGLQIVADETIAQFDSRAPEGADIVIVPAQARPNSPALLAWLHTQAARGAIIISVCEGSRVLARAGLLDGRRATSHWGSLDELTRAYPRTTWVRNRRYVQDGQIISTAGVTASIPMSLALVEAIGGHDAAATTARRLGLANWNATHSTAAFAIEPADIAAARAASRAPRERAEIPLEDGVDEVALALQTEAWGRSIRADVVTTRAGRAIVRSRHGLSIVPDAEARPGSHVITAAVLPAVPQLEETFAEMGRRYGMGVARLAILAMEYDPAPQPAN